MAYILSKVGQSFNVPVYIYEADTEEDMNTIDLQGVPMGSKCYIMNAGKWYMLNSKGEWKIMPSGSGGGASGDYIPVPATAEVGQSVVVKAVDETDKPTEWEAAMLAKADGSNVPTTSSAQDKWTTRIGALPGIKIYGKADANGKIMAYSDAACTEAVDNALVFGLVQYGNALLIFDHKTYQCVGFSESQYAPGDFTVTHFFRAEIAATGNTSVYHVEHAVLDIIGYLTGAIDAPIKITAGDIPMTTTTTT